VALEIPLKLSWSEKGWPVIGRKNEGCHEFLDLRILSCSFIGFVVGLPLLTLEKNLIYDTQTNWEDGVQVGAT
jgi:hypothetical protein